MSLCFLYNFGYITPNLPPKMLPDISPTPPKTPGQWGAKNPGRVNSKILGVPKILVGLTRKCWGAKSPGRVNSKSFGVPKTLGGEFCLPSTVGFNRKIYESLGFYTVFCNTGFYRVYYP